ncbi:hypothetical protein [Kaistia sp. UC242_56]|uniref:hypothetical protein n=1 Tax=Kaistia sp. UC242_56 TaxID=3374625 RepID=UPI003799C28E
MLDQIGLRFCGMGSEIPQRVCVGGDGKDEGRGSDNAAPRATPAHFVMAVDG